MTLAELPSLYPELEERRTPPGRGMHGYYRRKTDGWIITGAAWPTAKADKEFKGWEFLPQFGTFTMDMGKASTRDVRGYGFSVVSEPWRLIFQFPGGPEMFPVSQVIAYRWHLRPPYREAFFPQIEGIKITDLFCPECEKGIFSAENEQDAIDMLRVHLTSRTNDAHSYRPEDLKSLGTEYGIDFFAPRRGRRPVTGQVVIKAPRRGRRPVTGQVVIKGPSEEPSLNQRVTFSCPDCGFAAASRDGLITHRKTHEE